MENEQNSTPVEEQASEDVSVQETVQTVTPVADTPKEQQVNAPKKKPVALIIAIVLVVVAGVVGVILLVNQNKTEKEDKGEVKEVEKKEQFSTYRMNGNGLQDFDLYFLQLENSTENKVFSPLSIKYALRMLEEGADGDTKSQISAVLGDYNSKKYINSKNLSLANGIFIKDTFKNDINSSYVTTLQDKYGAEVSYDSFKSADLINKWIKNKTLNLIDNAISDDISTKEFILLNALAIDMEWVKKIQCYDYNDECYSISFAHRDYGAGTSNIKNHGFHVLDFNNKKMNAKSVEFYAVANRYDIIKSLGEDNIKKTITDEYNAWLKNDAESESCEYGKDSDANTFVTKYMSELKEGYNDVSSSTDLLFYTDDNVKVFAKDLKSYSGTTLQYVGIMPVKESLVDYIKNMKAENVSKLISSLKPIELNSFKDGVLTEVHGFIPLFDYDYSLKLKEDLTKMGITDVFDKNKSNLSKISEKSLVVDEVSHKTNIKFSNDGIKAAAVTVVEGGEGAAGCGYDHIYKVPVEKIDLTFDKPFVYFVRDKDTGEVWFAGTVYEPTK